MLSFGFFQASAQNVAINATGVAPVASAMLDISSTTMGSLIPRMTSVQRTAIVAPATGLEVYDLTTASFWYFNGVIWVQEVNTGLGWLLTGNTLAGTEFIGSINAQPFVIRTTNAERMRVDANGFVGINIAPSATYQLLVSSTLTSIYGASTGATTYGVLGTSTSATGFGVDGFNSNASGTGVLGTGNNIGGSYLVGGSGGAFSSTSVGVYGYGNNTAASWGVYGTSINATGIGVIGIATIGTGTGTYGWNNAAASASVGFGGYFTSNQTGGAALVGSLGLSSYFAGAGVSGISNSTVANGTGVIGMCNNGTGVGVWGQSNGANGDGVYGVGGSATGSAFAGYNSNASGTGAIISGNNIGGSYLGVGSGGAFTGILYGVYAKSTQAGVTQNAAVYGANGSSGVVSWLSLYNGTQYKTVSSGVSTNSCSVPDTNGNFVCMHAPETPEAYFEDYGEGQLINGKVHIELDPNFAKNIRINEKHPLRVFVQLYGNCNGVYITNTTETGFDVIELNGGNSNTHFQYHVICNMRDAVMPTGVISKFEDLRFEPAPKIIEEKTTDPIPAKKPSTNPIPAKKTANQ